MNTDERHFFAKLQGSLNRLRSEAGLTHAQLAKRVSTALPCGGGREVPQGQDLDLHREGESEEVAEESNDGPTECQYGNW